MTSRGHWIVVLFVSTVIFIVADASDQDEIPVFEVFEELDKDGKIDSAVTEDTELKPKRQFKTAEIADAVLGTEVSADSAQLESLIPKVMKDASLAIAESSGEKREDVTVFQEFTESKTTEQTELVAVGIAQTESGAADEQNSTETAKTYKVSCDKRSLTGLENFTVHVLNASQDLMDFLNANSTECSLVLFYTTWCQFSANLAPHFNALPRVFPIMHFLALDASQHSSLSTRFGTVAVPNILLFQGVKPMARFNHTDRTLETLTSFITNQTGFEAVPDQSVQEEDRLGPLPSVPLKSIDWLFVFSVLFISAFTLYAILRTDSIRLLIPGQEHEHQE